MENWHKKWQYCSTYTYTWYRSGNDYVINLTFHKKDTVYSAVVHVHVYKYLEIYAHVPYSIILQNIYKMSETHTVL